jgi:hypothetical protein
MGWIMGRLTLFVLCIVACQGCTSMRSTMINRHEDETYSGNSNGQLKWHNTPRPYKGVPITIKVPTHLDVTVTETSYLQDTTAGLREFRLTLPHRDVSIVTVETEKVFVVDFKRPISGTLNYSAKFGSDQYFDEISGKLEDTTITDVANLVATIAPLAGKKASGEVDASSDIGKSLITNTRVIAYQRFDIDACDVEAQIKQFLDQHLNCGHSCNPAQRVLNADLIEPIENPKRISAPPAAVSTGRQYFE